MIITHSGDFSVKKSQQEVFEFLTDPARFAPLLPNFQGLEIKDDGAFSVKLKVGVSHIRGTATVNLRLDEKNPHEKAVYSGTGSMAGGSVKLGAGFNLLEIAEGTRVDWTGEAQIFGKIASIARGLLEPLTRKNIQQLIDSLQKSLSEPSGGSAHPPQS